MTAVTVVVHDCGCEERGERFFECCYHEGFRDAMEQANELLRETTEFILGCNDPYCRRRRSRNLLQRIRAYLGAEV